MFPDLNLHVVKILCMNYMFYTKPNLSDVGKAHKFTKRSNAASNHQITFIVYSISP